MADMKTLTIGGVTFTVVDGEAVHFTEQTLTEEQKSQARTNLGIVGNGNGIALVQQGYTMDGDKNILSNTVTLTLDDGQTISFTVENGTDGADGTNGSGLYMFDPTVAPMSGVADRYTGGVTLPPNRYLNYYDLLLDNNGNVYQVTQLLGGAFTATVLFNIVEKAKGVCVEPAEDDIPKVFFGGALPQTKTDAVMSFRYISKTADISGYCKTKAQGNTSMDYPKKNQTVKLYKDAECTEKLKVDFKGWGKQSKFCFKANWIDLSHARNIVSCRLWGDVVKSRSNYAEIPELLRTSPNDGAVDGFPVKVYANGVYQGRYTINIPKDAWMANMDDELNTHCILCSENYFSSCFRAEAVIDGTDWTDELHDTVPDAIKTRWNEVIDFVMNSTDDEFIAGIDDYIDLESLIDYYAFGLVTCNLDGFGKNQLFHTYDGQKWYATVYDLDCTFGSYMGTFKVYNFPRSKYEDFNASYQAREGNLLYIRIESLFADEIKARYAELRSGALSFENIVNRFERFTDIASSELVKEDYAETTANGQFTEIPLKEENNIQQIRAYVHDRLSYTDCIMNDTFNGLWNGTHKFTEGASGASLNVSVTVTDGNTVTISNPDGATYDASMDISRIVTNSVSITNGHVNYGYKDTIFSLKSGDVVRSVMNVTKNTTGGWCSASLCKAGVTDTIVLVSSGETSATKTVTLTEDVDVGSLMMYTTKHTDSVTFEVYVNDVRIV